MCLQSMQAFSGSKSMSEHATMVCMLAHGDMLLWLHTLMDSKRIAPSYRIESSCNTLLSVREDNTIPPHMSGALDIRKAWTQLHSPVQKTCLLAAGSHVNRTGFARNYRSTLQHPQPVSERQRRLRSSVARSSKDDRSGIHLSPDSHEHQGVGRKQFLRALSSRRRHTMLK